MKTSLIAYRVADFLKENPPFQSIRVEDLLPLARSGRVVFHTEEEFVCQQNDPCKPNFWVIQQGSVELLEEPNEAIRDLLTAGDIFGVDPFAGAERYTYSARTSSEVILYALDLAELAELRKRSAAVDRYLRALLSIQSLPVSAPADLMEARPDWLPACAVTEAILKAHLVCCSSETPIGEVASKMILSKCHVSAITCAAGFPLGIVTDMVLQSALAGGVAAATPVGSIMQTEFPVTPPGFSLEESVLIMMRERESFLVVTQDGSSASPVEGVLTEATVQLLAGVSPSLLVRRAREADSIDELSVVRERAFAFVAQHLQDATNVGWFSEFLSAFLNAFTVRLIELCVSQMEGEGYRLPKARWCWVVFGAAGRGELLTPVAPSGAFVFEDRGVSSDCASWFEHLACRLAESYEECGLAPPTPIPMPWRAGRVEDWARTYKKLVSDPVFEHIYERRLLFDFRAAAGDASLAEALRVELRSLLVDAAAAVALLGNDCLENLPPLTLYQNLVVETDGSRRSALDLARTGLEPLADVGRVFALASGDAVPSGTVDRLMRAASAYSGQQALILEAAEAFRVLMLTQCRTGIRESSNGSTIYPAVLSRYDQLLLKSAFRAVQRVLEFAYANAFSFRD